MHPKRLRQFLLIFFDSIFFYIALFFALSIRNNNLIGQVVFEAHIAPFLFVLIISLATNYIMGLYDGFGISRSITSVFRIFEAGTISFLLGALYFYLLSNQLDISPKTILLLTIVCSVIGAVCIRILFTLIFHKTTHKIRIAIIGYTPEVQEILPLLSDHIDISLTHIVHPTNVAHVPTLPHIRDIALDSIDVLYITSDALEDNDTRSFLYRESLGKKSIIPFTELYEQLTGKIPMSLCSKEWLITNIDTPSIWYQHVRTLIDFVFGILLGLCTLVLLPFVSLAIIIGSRGPVFLSQTRIGQYGKEFRLYKFRTMYALAADGSAETAGAVFSTKGDSRITPIGRFLRKTRIDEFPQAWNLLRRDISLIGPRPERPEVVASLIHEAPFFPVRTLIKPGITGWAAVKQHYTDTKATTIEKLQYDLYYIKHRNLLLDASILLRTISAMIHLRGQ
jgi:lipopolysaccharide/colanic/teichoic acid biosynthesis glycosyltransferase